MYEEAVAAGSAAGGRASERDIRAGCRAPRGVRADRDIRRFRSRSSAHGHDTVRIRDFEGTSLEENGKSYRLNSAGAEEKRNGLIELCTCEY